MLLSTSTNDLAAPLITTALAISRCRGVPDKTITISREAYEALLKEMRAGETPSDVILRLVKERRKSLLDFAGKWAGNPEELVKAVEELREFWRKWGARVR